MIKGVECNRKIYPCVLVDDELHGFYRLLVVRIRYCWLL